MMRKLFLVMALAAIAALAGSFHVSPAWAICPQFADPAQSHPQSIGTAGEACTYPTIKITPHSGTDPANPIPKGSNVLVDVSVTDASRGCVWSTNPTVNGWTPTSLVQTGINVGPFSASPTDLSARCDNGNGAVSENYARIYVAAGSCSNGADNPPACDHFPPPPTTNNSPQGAIGMTLDVNSDIVGYANDADNCTAPVTVEFYLDRPPSMQGSGFLGTAVARGTGCNTSHTFAFQTTTAPWWALDGRSHVVYAQADNVAPTGSNHMLLYSGVASFVFATADQIKSAAVPAGSDPNVDSGGGYMSFDEAVTDGLIPSRDWASANSVHCWKARDPYRNSDWLRAGGHSWLDGDMWVYWRVAWCGKNGTVYSTNTGLANNRYDTCTGLYECGGGDIQPASGSYVAQGQLGSKVVCRFILFNSKLHVLWPYTVDYQTQLWVCLWGDGGYTYGKTIQN